MAAGDVFVIEDTGSASNVSHTTEADQGLSGSPVLEQGDWNGEWTSPDLNIPNTTMVLAGYSEFLRSSGTQRSGSLIAFRVNAANAGIEGVGSWGYNRLAGGHEESTRNALYLDNLTSGDDLQIRRAIQLNASDRAGDYDRTAGDPRGLWAVDLGTDQDYLFASITGTDTGSGRYRNASPIDLGTPEALTAGTWKIVTWDSTDDSSGSTITRSGSTFTVAANSKVLCIMQYQLENEPTDRTPCLMKMNKDGSPYAYSTVYHRGTSYNEGSVGNLSTLIMTGGSSETVEFHFVDESEDTGVGEIDIGEASVRFVDLTGQDVAILGKDDADVTTIDATVRQFSFPAGDEIQVDSASFDHPGGNLTRISNNAGETITVLCGWYVMADRSSVTNANRKEMMCQLRKSGTQIDYAVAGEYSRGQQSGDDTHLGGTTFMAPVELTSGQYLELDYYDLANAAASDLIVNATDGAAILFWAIRLDDMGAGAQSVNPVGITPDEALGEPTITAGAVTVSPDAITSDETLGTPTVTQPVRNAQVSWLEFEVPAAVGQTLNPVGITPDETFGEPTLSMGAVTVSPVGITSDEALGAPTIISLINPDGVASGEALGEPTIATGLVTISPDGIISAEAVGEPTVTVGAVTISPDGIISAEAFGSPTLTPGAITVSPDGIASTEALGTPSLIISVNPTGVASDEAFGAPTLTTGPVTVSPDGITSDEAIGTPTLGTFLFPPGITSDEAFGAPTLSVGAVAVNPDGITSDEALGAPTLTVYLNPPSITSDEAIGAPTISAGAVTVSPDGITSDEAIGAPTITTGPVTVSPDAITSNEAIGEPTVTGEAQIISPSGIASGEALGTPTVTSSLQIIYPPGIASAEAIGTPTVTGGEEEVILAGVILPAPVDAQLERLLMEDEEIIVIES